MFTLETKRQKEQRIIQNIHNDFDNAQDRLLIQAKEILALIRIDDIDEQELIADRYLKIGFENVPIVKKIVSLKKERQEKQKKIVKTKAEAELIEYYKANYPFLKFLTESELDKICVKYGLVYAPVKNYIEAVPEKNLIEIEQAQQLNKSDAPDNTFLLQIRSWWHACPNEIRKILGGKVEWKNGQHCTDELCLELARELGYRGNYNSWIFGVSGATLTNINKQGLFICAPESHFDTAKLKKEGFGFFEFTKTEIKDPIVFRYVRGGIQVLSKWGLEANDEILLNPINN